MKIPKEIRYSGLVWKIEESEPVSNEGNVFGSTHFRKQKIFIDPSENQLKKEQTFLHELMHVVWDVAGFNIRYKDQKNLEEEVVTAMSHGLYGLMRDNNLLK